MGVARSRAHPSRHERSDARTFTALHRVDAIHLVILFFSQRSPCPPWLLPYMRLQIILRSNHELAAVDFNRLAVNITRGVGGQEGDHSSAFFRRSETAHRN